VAEREKKCKICLKEESSVRSVCGMVESRVIRSLFVREGLLSILQGLNERLPLSAEGGTFSFPCY